MPMIAMTTRSSTKVKARDLEKAVWCNPGEKKSHAGSVVTIKLFSRQQLNEFASIRSRGPT